MQRIAEMLGLAADASEGEIVAKLKELIAEVEGTRGGSAVQASMRRRAIDDSTAGVLRRLLQRIWTSGVKNSQGVPVQVEFAGDFGAFSEYASRAIAGDVSLIRR